MLNPTGQVPIITTTMLRYDPQTFVVYATEPSPSLVLRQVKPKPKPEPAGRLLGALAIAGLTAKAVELAVLSPRRR